MSNIPSAAAELAQRLRKARHAVVFTGAGMSTESGIPDFRSPGGIWTRMQPIMFDDFVRSESARQESWRRTFEGERGLAGKTPNAGHRTLAHWVQNGHVAHVITQNVDNLHQSSGVPERQLTELHGNATYASCLQCGQRYEFDALQPDFDRDGQVRLCENCSGLLKIATISFGQPMPQAQMRRAEQEAERADLFICMGSSLQVYPAAGLPQLARTAGAQLVILNREATPLDDLADQLVHAEIGPALTAVQAQLDA